MHIGCSPRRAHCLTASRTRYTVSQVTYGKVAKRNSALEVRIG
jgi:hypothetical protein